MGTYLQSKNRIDIGKWFSDHFGANDLLQLQELPKNVTLFHDIWPLGYQSAHLLLWTTEHVLSVSQSSAEQIAGMNVAKNILLTKLGKMYPNHDIVWFEHGPGYIDGVPISCGGCHVDQAHIHFVVFRNKHTFDDLASEIEGNLQKSGWDNIPNNKVTITNWDELKNSVTHFPYLLVGIKTNSGEITEVAYLQNHAKYTLESQFMRKIISTLDGFPETKYWHWRDVMEGLGSKERLKELQNNVLQFQKAFLDSSDNIPKTT